MWNYYSKIRKIMLAKDVNVAAIGVSCPALQCYFCPDKMERCGYSTWLQHGICRLTYCTVKSLSSMFYLQLAWHVTEHGISYYFISFSRFIKFCCKFGKFCCKFGKTGQPVLGLIFPTFDPEQHYCAVLKYCISPNKHVRHGSIKRTLVLVQFQ